MQQNTKAALNRFSHLLWVFLAALFLLFAYPPFNQAWLAWVGLVPVFLFARRGRSFLVGWLFGLFFHGLGLLWVTALSPLGWAVLTLYLSLYSALFFFLSSRFSPPGWALKTAALAVVLEFIAGSLLTGFPWFSLALTQHRNALLLRLAPLGGAWLISFFVCLVNGVVFTVLQPRRKNEALGALLVTVLLLHLAVYPPRPSVEPGGPALDYALVQGNVPSSLRRQGPTLEPYLEVTRTLRQPVDLIIWPETSFVAGGGAAPPPVAALLAEKGAYLLAGVLDRQDGRLANSAALFAPDGTRRAWYRKSHLVPFGEYIPGRRFPLVRRLVERDAGFLPSFTAGDGPVRMSVRGVPLAPLICYESIFPLGVARAAVPAAGRRPVIVLLTNDSWLGLLGAGQHFGAAALRAAENGTALLRAANTGISASIDGRGRVRQRTLLRRTAVLTGRIGTRAAGPTPFQRFPLATPLACLALLVACALTRRLYGEMPRGVV